MSWWHISRYIELEYLRRCRIKIERNRFHVSKHSIACLFSRHEALEEGNKVTEKLVVKKQFFASSKEPTMVSMRRLNTTVHSPPRKHGNLTKETEARASTV